MRDTSRKCKHNTPAHARGRRQHNGSVRTWGWPCPMRDVPARMPTQFVSLSPAPRRRPPPAFPSLPASESSTCPPALAAVDRELVGSAWRAVACTGGLAQRAGSPRGEAGGEISRQSPVSSQRARSRSGAASTSVGPEPPHYALAHQPRCGNRVGAAVPCGDVSRLVVGSLWLAPSCCQSRFGFPSRCSLELRGWF